MNSEEGGQWEVRKRRAGERKGKRGAGMMD